MRRSPFGGGWIVLAAAAVPFVVHAAKPLAKAVGKGLKRLGEIIDEAANEVESPDDPVETAQVKTSEKAVPTKPTPEAKAPKVVPKKASAKKPVAKKVDKPAIKKPKTVMHQPARHEPPKPSVVKSASMISDSPTGRRRPPSDVQTG